MKTLLFVAGLIYCSAYNSKNLFFRNILRQKKPLNLNETFFPQLKNYRVDGTLAKEDDYPWISKVLHSLNKTVPYICTAVCIEDNIFISAARCVYKLKVAFTSIVHGNQHLTVKALVVPSKPTKQLYDDIGFIITNGALEEWFPIQNLNNQRTDDDFHWFEDLEFGEFDHKVVGYAFAKTAQNLPIWLRTIDLVELDVAVGKSFCNAILSYHNLIDAFNVPCYHSCNYEMFLKKNDVCKKYHGVEGGALINKKTNSLFGIATWGVFNRQFELPVGFAVPNSQAYFEDLECARKIKHNKEPVGEGFYQKLCDQD